MRAGILIAAAMILFALSCTKVAPVNDNQMTGSSVQELKETACDSADSAGTCDTRLPELGFITKEECCESFKKCCSQN